MLSPQITFESDLNAPSFQNSDSAYKRLLKETQSGTYPTSWGKMPIGEVYVPPWEQTMIDIYGKKTVDAMRAEGAESYVERANRFAKQEAAARAAGSKKALGAGYE